MHHTIRIKILKPLALWFGPTISAFLAHSWTWGPGNRLKLRGSILVGCRFKIHGKNNVIAIEEGCILRNIQFTLIGDNNAVIIRRDARFGRSGSDIWLEDGDCRLEIGRRTIVEGVHFAVTEPGCSITVGDDCLFSVGIELRTGDSHPVFDADTGVRINPAESIVIADRVWVGAHARILKGVHLASDTVVGTAAVVSTGFAEGNCVVAGNPARVVRSRTSWGLFRDQASIAEGTRFRKDEHMSSREVI